MLGFYPYNPASAEYVLGMPQIVRSRIRLQGGKVLEISNDTVVVDRDSTVKTTLNGRVLMSPSVKHADLVNGGLLEFR